MDASVGSAVLEQWPAVLVVNDSSRQFPLKVPINTKHFAVGILQTTNWDLWYQRVLKITQSATTGYVQASVLTISILVLAFNTVRLVQRRAHVEKHLNSASASSPSPLLTLLGHVVRASAVSLSAVACRSSSGLGGVFDTALVGLAFAVGLARLFVRQDQDMRAHLLHQVNILLLCSFIIVTLETVAPLAIISSPFQIADPSISIAKLGSIALSLIVAFITPREWREPQLAFNLVHRTAADGSSPEETCSWFGYYMSYSWLSKIIMTGCKRGLVLDDVLPLPYYDEPLIWLERIVEARKKYVSTLRTMASVLQKDLRRQVFFAASTAVTEFIAPFAMYNLLGYLSSPETSIMHPVFWVILLFVGPVSRSVSYQQYIFNSTRLIIHTKSSLIQELYRKALKTLNFAQPDGNKGSFSAAKEDAVSTEVQGKTNDSQQILNLFSYDVDAIWQSRDLILVSVASPIELAIAITFLYKMLSWCALVGLVIMLSSFPLARFLSKRLSAAQKQVMAATDKRIALLSECLSSIRTIKYLSWESAMQERITAARKEEQGYIWRRNLYAVAVSASGDFIPLFSLFTMFFCYTLISGQHLTPAIAFTSLSIVETIRQQFVWMSNVTRFLANGTIACQRIDSYFATAISTQKHPVGPPAFYNATFRRTPTSDFYLRNIDVRFIENKLNVITGISGSGKSSLLLALIGETILESGSATCPEHVAYAGQSAWLLSDSIRANVTFHGSYHPERFQKVMAACGLLKDLEDLPEGDLSHVGENGTSLSGGQRQRIALARAVYSDAPVLLLDDIFSALDVETSAHIWKECFCGDLVKGRTVILVTQQAWLSEEADLAISMSHGEISSIVRRENVQRRDSLTASEVRELTTIPQIPKRSKKTQRQPSQSVPTGPNEDVEAMLTRGDEECYSSAVVSETSSKGRNPRSLFYKYMLLFGGHPYAIFQLVLSFAAQLAFFSLTLWLSVWVTQYSKEEAVNVGFYLSIYACALLSFSVVSGLNTLSFQFGAWRAARTMHDRLLNAIFSVPLSWFADNPVGRIINRFSRDIFSMDSLLIEFLRTTVDNGIRLLLRIGAIGSIMPIFALPAAVVCSVGFVLGEMYTKSQLSIKALNSAAQSPIFNHFTDSVAGLDVIRAYGTEDAFADVLARRIRVQARTEETQYNLNRWISVRADVGAASVAFMAGLLALYKAGDVSAGLVGFSLTNAIGLSTTILNLVRGMNELEVELNCFQRIREYADLPSEEQKVLKQLEEPGSQLESTSLIEFRNVTARYTEDGPDILKNISFSVQQGERVAVIGRTGSGKSTLALCLLRFVKIVSGAIYIDGVDISTMPLTELRRFVSIIPQDPVLFSGTVRDNLDPTYTIGESLIEDAFEACSNVTALAAQSESRPESRSGSESGSSTPKGFKGISLSTSIAAKGENLSQGQRQVLGVARAIARHSKIVILDEATASVDRETDAAIQDILRTQFDRASMLTIAHRLSTIKDYDKIVVLSGGVLQEMGRPKDLWKKKGNFYDMVKHSNEAEEIEEYLEDDRLIVTE